MFPSRTYKDPRFKSNLNHRQAYKYFQHALQTLSTFMFNLSSLFFFSNSLTHVDVHFLPVATSARKKQRERDRAASKFHASRIDTFVPFVLVMHVHICIGVCLCTEIFNETECTVEPVGKLRQAVRARLLIGMDALKGCTADHSSHLEPLAKKLDESPRAVTNFSKTYKSIEEATKYFLENTVFSIGTISFSVKPRSMGIETFRNFSWNIESFHDCLTWFFFRKKVID